MVTTTQHIASPVEMSLTVSILLVQWKTSVLIALRIGMLGELDSFVEICVIQVLCL